MRFVKNLKLSNAVIRYSFSAPITWLLYKCVNFLFTASWSGHKMNWCFGVFVRLVNTAVVNFSIVYRVQAFVRLTNKLGFTSVLTQYFLVNHLHVHGRQWWCQLRICKTNPPVRIDDEVLCVSTKLIKVSFKLNKFLILFCVYQTFKLFALCFIVRAVHGSMGCCHYPRSSLAIFKFSSLF